MHKAILLGLAILSIATISGFSMMQGSLSAVCMPTFWQVSASEAPEFDENQNGYICKYIRQGNSQQLTVYDDDV